MKARDFIDEQMAPVAPAPKTKPAPAPTKPGPGRSPGISPPKPGTKPWVPGRRISPGTEPRPKAGKKKDVAKSPGAVKSESVIRSRRASYVVEEVLKRS